MTTVYRMPVNKDNLHFPYGIPVVPSFILPWRQMLLETSNRPSGDWRLIVGSRPKYADPAVERVRRQAVLEARRVVRDGLQRKHDVLDDIYESTIDWCDPLSPPTAVDPLAPEPWR